nr:hypothetical protein [Tanacetum cinerariifolium]
MPDSAFRKRFRSSYDSSPSPTLPFRKRYRGLGYGSLRRQELSLEEDRIYSTFEVGQDSLAREIREGVVV